MKCNSAKTIDTYVSFASYWFLLVVSLLNKINVSLKYASSSLDIFKLINTESVFLPSFLFISTVFSTVFSIKHQLKTVHIYQKPYPYHITIVTRILRNIIC